MKKDKETISKHHKMKKEVDPLLVPKKVKQEIKLGDIVELGGNKLALIMVRETEEGKTFVFEPVVKEER